MTSRSDAHYISDEEDGRPATKRSFVEDKSEFVPSATLQILDRVLFDWSSESAVSITEPSWDALALASLSTQNAKVPASPQTAFESLTGLPPQDPT